MNRERQKGVITIEATLVLPIFIAAMVIFISYAKIAILEMRMQYAAGQTAKEISQYFYIANKFGLDFDGTQGNDKIDEVLSSMDALKDTGGKAISSIDVEGLTDTINGLQSGDKESIMKALNEVKGCFDGDNPIDIVKTLIAAVQGVKSAVGNVTSGDVTSVAGNAAGAFLSNAIAGPISKALFEKYIPGEADETLNRWGIEDGMDGIDFVNSSFLSDGQTIEVVLVYQVDLFSLGFWDMEMTLSQVATTRAWVGDSKEFNIKYTPKTTEQEVEPDGETQTGEENESEEGSEEE